MIEILNPFVIRKYISILIPALINPILFFVGLQFYDLLGGLGFLAVGLILSLVVSNLLLKNPFTGMLEGSGILALNITSTGIIKPFLVNVQGGLIRGKLGKTSVIDVFDREAVNNFALPQKVSKKANWDNGILRIELHEDEYNKNRFGLFQYPCLLYNDHIGSFVTKDFLSDGEKTVFAEHSILYLKKLLEDLNSNTRDFGRYIVEQLKPKGDLFGNKWFWIVSVVLMVLLVAMFAPAVLEQIGGSGFFGQANDAIGQATAGATVAPLPAGT